MAGLGHCYTQKGDFKRALTHYRMAHQINPNVNAVQAAIERLQARVRDANDASDHFVQEKVGVWLNRIVSSLSSHSPEDESLTGACIWFHF